MGPLLAPNGSALQTLGGGDDPLSAQKAVDVTPSEFTLDALGHTRQLQVTVRNGAGRIMPNPSVTWTSGNPEVATVDGAGRVTAVGVGIAVITAAAQGSSDAATVTVRQLLASVAVEPAVASVEVNANYAFTAIAADANGVAIPGVGFVWSSSDPTAAIVSTQGVATGVAEGLATITATAEESPPGAPIAGSAALTVVPAGSQPPGVATVTVTPAAATIEAGGTVQLAAAAFDSDGVPLERTFTWSAAMPGIVTISGDGLVTGVSTGVVAVMALADGVGGTSNITVQAAPPPPPPPPPPPGGYSPSTPHWSHIRLFHVDFSTIYIAPHLRNAQWEFIAAKNDWVTGPSNIAALKQHNPTVRWSPYTIVLTVWNNEIVQGLATQHMLDWYNNPALNVWGYHLEDAFLHTALPKSPATRLQRMGWRDVDLEYYYNVADPGYREYVKWRTRQMVYHNGTGFEADGVHFDGHDRGDVSKGYGSVELATAQEYDAAHLEFLQIVRQNLGPGKVLECNLTLYGNAPVFHQEIVRAQALACGAVYWEGDLWALKEVEPAWAKWEWMTQNGVMSHIVSQYERSSYDALGANFTPGNEASKGARGKLWELTSYYMIRPADPALIDRVKMGWHYHEHSWEVAPQWVRAIETNVGHPREQRRVYWQGTLPNYGWAWRIWGREYDNALVLNRPVTNWSHTQHGDDTAVTVTLPAGQTWYMLYENGTVGSTPLTQLTLRNGEGAILLKGSAP